MKYYYRGLNRQIANELKDLLMYCGIYWTEHQDSGSRDIRLYPIYDRDLRMIQYIANVCDLNYCVE